MRAFKAVVVGFLMAMSFVDMASARTGILERLREARAERAATDDKAEQHAIHVGGIERSYLLLDAHDGNGPAPLVIALHGGGGSSETMIPRWAGAAHKEGLVIAAPKGIGRGDRMGTWNASGCCGEAMQTKVDDVAFIAAVIDDVSKRTSIDPQRIYVTGFSNGGMLTHRIAIAMGDRLAAVAVVSGALFGDEPAPRAPVSVLIIHGEQDPVVGFGGGMSGTEFVAKSESKPFLPVRSAVDFWRRADGCQASPQTESAPGLTKEVSADCQKGTQVVFYDLPKGKHTWPSATARGRRPAPDESPSPIDATDVIWAFFKTQIRK